MSDDKNYSQQEITPQETKCLENPPFMTMDEARKAIKGDLNLLGCMDIEDLRQEFATPDNSYSKT